MTEASDNVTIYDAHTIAPLKKKYERKINASVVVAGTWTPMALMAKYRSYVQKGTAGRNRAYWSWN